MKKLILLSLIGFAVAGFFMFGGADYVSLEALKAGQEKFASVYADHPVLTVGIFALAYVLIAALSLPGAAVMTLAAGALFGLWVGFIIVSFASTIGATLAFLAARYLMGEGVQKTYGDRLKKINQGIEKEGAFYLLFMRLVPIFPFFVVNILMGLTKMPVVKYFVVSQIGMIPGTLVYVFAGTALADVNSLGDIVSGKMLLAFTLLGTLPLITKKIIDGIKARKIYKGYTKPKSYDYNLVAIGGGAAGLVSTYIGAAVNAKVALIEKHKMGGDCLNTGCVPSKALIKTAKVMNTIQRHEDFGLKSAEAKFDFKDVMKRVHRIIKTIEPHDSPERYRGLGVDVIEDKATLIDPWTIELDSGRRITTQNIVLATGAEPFVPAFSGLDKVPYYTSDTLWEMKDLPKRLVVLGGGPIGSEMTQAFARLGSQVTQVERMDRIMAREDADVSAFMAERFEAEGITVLTEHDAVGFESSKGKHVIVLEHKGKTKRVEFDAVLIAIGRTPRTTGYGLENLNIELTDRGAIANNDYLQTNYPNIYVAGDIAGRHQFTHVAAHHAWYAAVNALFGRFKKFIVDERVIPWVTYTDPEVARVGLSESEATEKGIAFDVTRYDLDDLDRAITEDEAKGWVKVITPKGKDTILGATIVGHHAGDLLAEFVLAMKYKLGLNKVLGTIHAYPTFAEGTKFAAGEWKKANKPEGVLRWLEKYHTWTRGNKNPSSSKEAKT